MKRNEPWKKHLARWKLWKEKYPELGSLRLYSLGVLLGLDSPTFEATLFPDERLEYETNFWVKAKREYDELENAKKALVNKFNSAIIRKGN